MVWDMAGFASRRAAAATMQNVKILRMLRNLWFHLVKITNTCVMRK